MLLRLDLKEVKRERKKRIPLGSHRLKLNAPKREGYVRRWVNDLPGRLHMYQEAGYEFVDDPLTVGQSVRKGHNDLGSKTSVHVGTNEQGAPMRAYLMEIKQEWHDEDQLAKIRELDAIDAQIRGGGDTQGQPGQDGRYIPNEGIKYDIS